MHFPKHLVSMTRTKYFRIKFFISFQSFKNSTRLWIRKFRRPQYPFVNLWLVWAFIVRLFPRHFLRFASWYSPTTSTSGNYHTLMLLHFSNYIYLVWCKCGTVSMMPIHSRSAVLYVTVAIKDIILVKFGSFLDATSGPDHLAFSSDRPPKFAIQNMKLSLNFSLHIAIIKYLEYSRPLTAKLVWCIVEGTVPRLQVSSTWMKKLWGSSHA